MVWSVVPRMRQQPERFHKAASAAKKTEKGGIWQVMSVVACAVFAFALISCSPFQEARFYREGIGSDLYRTDLSDAELQSNYLNFLCQEATSTPGTADACGGVAWPLIVQAGMNDIDRRCDEFLTWVDYHKRSDTHWTKQIGDTVQTTVDILRFTNTATRSIDIVSAALGLGKNTFTNLSARMLTVADSDTVQSVVLGEQNRYRIAMQTQVINNRPAAVHALRSYLRICMPFTIDARINSTVTIFEQAGTQGLVEKERRPLIDPRTVSPGTAPVAPTQRVIQIVRREGTAKSDYKQLIMGYDEREDTVENFRPRLLKICASEMEADNVRESLPILRSLIKVYQFTNSYKPGDTALATSVTGMLTRAEIKKIGTISSTCDAGKFANFYEFREMRNGVNAPVFVDLLNKALPSNQQLDKNTAAVAQVRAKIGLARDSMKIPMEKLLFKDPFVEMQFTPDLRDALLGLP